MKHSFEAFLYGFSSIFDIFAPIDKLNLSRGGFAEDHRKLKNDVTNIKRDFSKVVYGKQGTGKRKN